MKKPLFIHIPKAAGTSIGRIVKKYNEDLPPCLHNSVINYPKEYRDSCFVFSFTRNPYDRLVSAHKYLVDGFGNNGDVKFGKTLSSDFKYFVKNQLNDNINWLHFRPMMFWLNDDVDFVGKIENLQQDFDIVCKKIGIAQQKLPQENKSKHKHYTEYYNKEIKQIVSDQYAKDIEYFRYKFGE